MCSNADSFPEGSFAKYVLERESNISRGMHNSIRRTQETNDLLLADVTDATQRLIKKKKKRRKFKTEASPDTDLLTSLALMKANFIKHMEDRTVNLAC